MEKKYRIKEKYNHLVPSFMMNRIYIKGERAFEYEDINEATLVYLSDEMFELIEEKDMNCEHCEFLEKVFGENIHDNREYWIFTEVFVRLHGTDVCNNKKLKPSEPTIDNGTKKCTPEQLQKIAIENNIEYWTKDQMIKLFNEWMKNLNISEDVRGMVPTIEESFKEFLKDK